jgi:hypothetical protein
MKQNISVSLFLSFFLSFSCSSYIKFFHSAKSDFFSRELDKTEIEEMQRIAFSRLSEITDILEVELFEDFIDLNDIN